MGKDSCTMEIRWWKLRAILFGYRGYIYIKRYFKITSIRFLVTFVWLTSPCEYFFFFSCLLMTKILMAVDEIIVNLLKLIVFIFKNLLRYYTNIINSSILEIERERKVKFADIYIFILFFKRYKSDSGKVFPLRKARSKSSSIPSRLHNRTRRESFPCFEDIGKTTFKTALYDSKLGERRYYVSPCWKIFWTKYPSNGNRQMVNNGCSVNFFKTSNKSRYYSY